MFLVVGPPGNMFGDDLRFGKAFTDLGLISTGLRLALGIETIRAGCCSRL